MYHDNNIFSAINDTSDRNYKLYVQVYAFIIVYCYSYVFYQRIDNLCTNDWACPKNTKISCFLNRVISDHLN